MLCFVLVRCIMWRWRQQPASHKLIRALTTNCWPRKIAPAKLIKNSYYYYVYMHTIILYNVVVALLLLLLCTWLPWLPETSLCSGSQVLSHARRFSLDLLLWHTSVYVKSVLNEALGSVGLYSISTTYIVHHTLVVAILQITQVYSVHINPGQGGLAPSLSRHLHTRPANLQLSAEYIQPPVLRAAKISLRS